MTDQSARADPPSAAEAGAASEVTGFRPMRMPSQPFVIALLGAFVAIALLVLSSGVLFIFALGVALSFFLVPIVNWLERRGINRIAGSMLTVAVVVVITLIIVIGGTAILVSQGVAFVNNLPSYIQSLSDTYHSLSLPAWLSGAIDALVAQLQATAAGVDSGSLALGFIQGALGLVGVFFMFMLLPFFTFYLIKDQPRMAGTFYRGLPAPWRDDVDYVLTVFVKDFATYFKAELLVGSMMFVIISVGMFCIGFVVGGPLMTFAMLLGLVAFVMELIPQIGPILSYIPALLLALTTSPEAVVLVSIYYFIAFNIEGSILVPTFEGKMISFSGATVLFLIACGFAVSGIIGAILALPLSAIARDVFKHFFDKAQDASAVTASGVGATGLSPEPVAAASGAPQRAPDRALA